MHLMTNCFDSDTCTFYNECEVLRTTALLPAKHVKVMQCTNPTAAVGMHVICSLPKQHDATAVQTMHNTSPRHHSYRCSPCAVSKCYKLLLCVWLKVIITAATVPILTMFLLSATAPSVLVPVHICGH